MSFRVVVWQMLYFWRDLSELPPNYDDCGNVCGESEELRTGFCDDCPIKLAEADFIENLTEMLDRRCPNQWQKYGIDNLRRTVIEAMRLEKSDVELTVTTDALIRIIESERNKMRRIDDWNHRQSNKREE